MNETLGEYSMATIQQRLNRCLTGVVVIILASLMVGCNAIREVGAAPSPVAVTAEAASVGAASSGIAPPAAAPEPPAPPVATPPPAVAVDPPIVTPQPPPALCSDRQLNFDYRTPNTPQVDNLCDKPVTIRLYVNELTNQPKVTYSTMTVTIQPKTRGYFSVTKPPCVPAQYDWEYVSGIETRWTYSHGNPHNAGGPDNVWKADPSHPDCQPKTPPTCTVNCTPPPQCEVQWIPLSDQPWEIDPDQSNIGAATFAVQTYVPPQTCKNVRYRMAIQVNSCTGEKKYATKVVCEAPK